MTSNDLITCIPSRVSRPLRPSHAMGGWLRWGRESKHLAPSSSEAATRAAARVCSQAHISRLVQMDGSHVGLWSPVVADIYRVWRFGVKIKVLTPGTRECHVKACGSDRSSKYKCISTAYLVGCKLKLHHGALYLSNSMTVCLSSPTVRKVLRCRMEQL